MTAEVLSGLPIESARESAEELPEISESRGRRAAGWSETSATDGGSPDVCVSHDAAMDTGPAELPPFLRLLLQVLDCGDPFELDCPAAPGAALATEIAPLLRHVACAGHEWRIRFHTLAGYAREHLGMSASKCGREDPEHAARPLDNEELGRQTCAQPMLPSEGGSLRIPTSRDVASLFRAVQVALD